MASEARIDENKGCGDKRQEQSKYFCQSGSTVDPHEIRRLPNDCKNNDNNIDVQDRMEMLQPTRQLGKLRNDEHGSRNTEHRKSTSELLIKQRRSQREVVGRKLEKQDPPGKYPMRDYPRTMMEVSHYESGAPHRHSVGPCKASFSDVSESDCGRPYFLNIRSMQYSDHQRNRDTISRVQVEDFQSRSFPLPTEIEFRSQRVRPAGEYQPTHQDGCSDISPTTVSAYRDQRSVPILPPDKLEYVETPFCLDDEGGICGERMCTNEHASVLAQQCLLSLERMEMTSKQLIRRCEELLADHSEIVKDIDEGHTTTYIYAKNGQHKEQDLCLVHAKDGSIAVSHKARRSTTGISRFQEFKS